MVISVIGSVRVDLAIEAGGCEAWEPWQCAVASKPAPQQPQLPWRRHHPRSVAMTRCPLKRRLRCGGTSHLPLRFRTVAAACRPVARVKVSVGVLEYPAEK